MFDEKFLSSVEFIILAMVFTFTVVGVSYFFVLNRERKRIARLGRFCENPACTYHTKSVNKDGYVIDTGRKIFTRVVQSQSGKSFNLCERCKSAVDLMQDST